MSDITRDDPRLIVLGPRDCEGCALCDYDAWTKLFLQDLDQRIKAHRLEADQ